MQFDNPLIVQSDKTLLLDVHAPLAAECRTALIPFAELERSPEHLHTYRLTPLSLWNASSAGFTPDDATSVLEKYSRYPVPQSVIAWINATAGRFGKLRLIPAPDPFGIKAREMEATVETGESTDKAEAGGVGESSSNVKSAEKDETSTGVGESAVIGESTTTGEPTDKTETTTTETEKKPIVEEYLYLVTDSFPIYKEIAANRFMQKYLTPCECTELSPDGKKQFAFLLLLTNRGTVKQELLKLSWPVKDDVPLVDGEPLEVSLRDVTLTGKPLVVRNYQKTAADALVGDGGPGTGFGTIVLPCGAGKTMVGMTVMERLKTSTLIVTTNISAVHQWMDELLDKTTLTKDEIAEYTGESKSIKPVTVATYQILTWRPEKEGPYPHFQLFRERAWGLIIYDEVHLLPAPVFRVVAELQAVRRVGLTATLVREDGCEGYVFSLVGPKRCDVPWKELEVSGWIASAECIELRVDMPEAKEIEYAVADARQKHRIASENPEKIPVVQELIHRFPDDKILVIGQYLEQLHELAELLHAPIITGKTVNTERDKIYNDFRSGQLHVLVVSKVANFAIDLPDASMAIQISGTFGSRQEEAQRLGRILRPKERTSRFFTLITRNTVEEEFGSNRQKFLAEQGYDYRLIRYLDSSSLNELMPACITSESQNN